MRIVILALCAVLLVAFGDEKKEGERPGKPDVGMGHVAWFDLTTTNLTKSKEFYGKLFDWRFTALPGMNVAVEIVAGETPVGTLRVAEGEISAFNGVVYIQVADMRDRCARAKELGGTIPPGFPFDLPDGKGAVGLVVDPSGHPVGMYSPTPLAAEKSPR